MTIKKDLLAMNKEIKSISRKLDSLLKAVEKTEKAKTAKKTPAKKKSASVTATDQVLKIINRYKKGVDTATLMKKTGFNQKKVTNILQRTFKQGKIKRAAKGIYIGVK